MPLRRWSPTTALIATALVFSSAAPAWGSSERLAAIPIPAALRPHLSAACKAWGNHIEELIQQHRFARELTEKEIDEATTLFYAAKSQCSMGKLLEAMAMFERISIGRAKNRPLW